MTVPSSIELVWQNTIGEYIYVDRDLTLIQLLQPARDQEKHFSYLPKDPFFLLFNNRKKLSTMYQKQVHFIFDYNNGWLNVIFSWTLIADIWIWTESIEDTFCQAIQILRKKKDKDACHWIIDRLIYIYCQ